MKVFQFPLIKITLFFVLGIVIAFYLKPSPFFSFLSLFIGVIFFVFSFFKSQKTFIPSRNYGNLFGISTLLLSLLIGVSNQVVHNEIYNKSHFVHKIGTVEKQHLMEVSLSEKLKFSEFNERFIANVTKFDSQKSSGKIILNIRKDSSYKSKLEIGSILKIKALVYKNKSIVNPNQFEYSKYLENKNIYAQVYVDENDIQISPEINKNLWFYAAKFRNTIISNLEKHGFAKRELAVVVALILGQQQDISQDVLQDYQFAGAIHILSVSGLHVGFIMLFIGYLLKPFPNTKKSNFIKLIIVIISLWLFGFVAGLAPSVLRSVVMFSFVAIGKHLGRSVNIYNTLCVSALLILLIQPAFLFDVGFQLSYTALYFIVWLQPLFEKIWQPRNKIINYLWEIITVSFAAQIGAMPLSIYYFHQFPGLFFVTNLIILPFMSIILAVGVVVMLLAYFDAVPHFLMKILEWSIWILDYVIGWIAGFEQFVIQNISMNKTILIALYILIFSVVIYFKRPKFNRLVVALLSIILLQISVFASKYYYQKQRELIVFNIKKNTLITERNGQNTIVFANDSILKFADKNMNLKNYLVGNFSHIQSRKNIPNLMFFGNKKILVLDSIALNPINLKPDILIITHSPKLNLERFLQLCQPKVIVADASNFKTYIKVWQKTCKQQKIPFHATAEKGFYRIE